jgi:hypothetical protein
MMVNTNSKLFLEILEQKGDDVYHNPDVDKTNYSGPKYEDEIKATHASLKSQLNDLRSKAEQGHLNAYSANFNAIDGQLAIIGQKLNMLNGKVEDINEDLGDFKARDIVNPGRWSRKGRLNRDQRKLDTKQ